MNRWMRIMLALVLACLLGAAGIAEGGTTAADGATAAGDVVSGRIDFTERIAPFAGKWVTFDDGFRLYLPQTWSREDLTEAQSQAGLFYREGNGGGDALVGDVPMGVAVGFAEAQNLSTLDDLVRDFEAAGFSGMDRLDINGIRAVSFDSPTAGFRGVAFYHPIYPGYVLAVYITPRGEDDAAVNAVGSAILCSLTPTGE